MKSNMEIASIDANLMSNLICEEVFGEYLFGEELGTALLVSASKNLQHIEAMQDFSINMLKKIARNEFTKIEQPKTRTIDDKLNEINKEIIFDISRPIQDMFEEMSGFVCEALAI